MPRISIKTTFGSIEFDYEDENELKSLLESVTDDTRIIHDHVSKLLPHEPREPKPGFEEIYRFTPKGLLELFHWPSTNVATVILALYLYYPHLAAVDELEKSTCIPEIVLSVLGQTNNKKYFLKEEHQYGLTPDGLEYFRQTILPSLPITPPTATPDPSEE